MYPGDNVYDDQWSCFAQRLASYPGTNIEVNGVLNTVSSKNRHFSHGVVGFGKGKNTPPTQLQGYDASDLKVLLTHHFGIFTV